MEYAQATYLTAIENACCEARSLSMRLANVVLDLEDIADDLSAREFVYEAGSIATVIADLRWQGEELEAGRTGESEADEG